MDEHLLEVYLINTARHTEETPVAEWVSLPTDAETMKAVFERLGVDGSDTEQYQVSAFHSSLDGWSEALKPGESLDDLNYLAALLTQRSNEERDKFAAAAQYGDHAASAADLINLTHNLDCYWLYPTVHNSDDYGHYLIDDLDELELPDAAKRFFDYKSYGREAVKEDRGIFTDYGYVYNNGNDYAEWYKANQVPQEYRLTAQPSPQRDMDELPQGAALPVEPIPVRPLVLNATDTQGRIKEITEHLEQGVQEVFESERYRDYLKAMSRFHNYSLNNTLLIVMQKPDASLVAGYGKWRDEFERHVKSGEKGIKILAPAPYKIKKDVAKTDPDTGQPVIGADGRPVTEQQEVTIPAFKVVSVFDVSQTEGKELPDIAVDALTGNVEQYEDFWRALKLTSPVPVTLEKIDGSAHGYYDLAEKRIAIDDGMSELQTIKTAIHEIAHAKLHAVTPGEKVAPEDKKDRRTKEVEAESVAYTVCQRYGIETSDYSFGYIAGWSSDKETKELKGSLETIRKTAAEMITGIDEKLKERLAVKEQEAPTPLRDAAIPVYREAAMYAFEAGELDAYRTSMQANMDCKEAIEQTINDYYGNNRLAAESAVKSILEKFSPERVAYVLAQTIQQKDHDGRISPDCKEWAKGMDGSPDHATQLIIDSVNPGLVSLFTEEFVRQTAISRTQEQAPAEQSKPAVPEKAPKEPEQAVPAKHRLTPEEKKIKEAVMDTLKAQIAGRNDGMLSTYRSSNQSFKVMMEYKVRIEGNTVTRDGEPMFAIHRRHSAKKVQGCYRELTPMLEYIGKEKTQEAAREKPSIREQLRAAAKSQPERKAPVKQKSRDAGLE